MYEADADGNGGDVSTTSQIAQRQRPGRSNTLPHDDDMMAAQVAREQEERERDEQRESAHHAAPPPSNDELPPAYQA